MPTKQFYQYKELRHAMNDFLLTKAQVKAIREQQLDFYVTCNNKGEIEVVWEIEE